jgi:hypothetical protein
VFAATVTVPLVFNVNPVEYRYPVGVTRPGLFRLPPDRKPFSLSFAARRSDSLGNPLIAAVVSKCLINGADTTTVDAVSQF